ncbi:MAG: TIGR00730 family Rossman fold protein [Gemmataceae bacterium]
MSEMGDRIEAVCVFCGSRTGTAPVYLEAARQLGVELARRGLEVVYGAGDVGLMGVLADAALEAGGRVVGVIPQSLVAREVAHMGLTELHVVETMHQRKALMADRAQAFLALPGGFGTADELFEILTWAQLGIHRKPVGLLNVNGFFDPLLAWLDHCVAEGFLKPQHRRVLLVARDVAELLDTVQHAPPVEETTKWADREDR